MHAADPARRNWFTVMLIVTAVYLVAGIGFGALAGNAASHRMVVTWRLAAWVVSAAAFAAQIAYEHLRLRSSARTTALDTSLAAALGAFGLAVAATLHSHAAVSGEHFPRIMLLLWPVVTAVPAFLVALAIAGVFGLMRRTE